GGSDAGDRLRQLPTDLGLLGIAEVEAVREAQRLATSTGDVTRGLEDRERPARKGVERRNPALSVERDREAPQRRTQPQNGGVEAGAPDGPRTDELVVPSEDGLPTPEPGRREQVDEGVGRRRRARDFPLGERDARLLRDLVPRALVREERGRD